MGKSSVTANLAVALAQRGQQVAVVDADVWGFSIPRMLGVEPTRRSSSTTMLVPPEAHGVRCISMGFFAEEDQPVIWRGPMLHKALEQFLTDVYWDDPDFLVVDLPPGHRRHLALAGPVPAPGRGLRGHHARSRPPSGWPSGPRFMAEKVNLEVKGVIENMSWFTGDDGKRYELFGAGGGPGAGRAARRPAARPGAAGPRAPRGRRLGPPDRGHRPRQRGGRRPSPPSPSASTSSSPPPVATTPSSSSSDRVHLAPVWPGGGREVMAA